MIFDRKGLGSVVATGLIIVVAVVATISFQSWFSNYESQVFVNSESQSKIISENSGIEALVGNKLYFKSDSNISILKVSIDGNDCNLSYNSSGLVNLTLPQECLDNLSTNTPEVLVQTSDRIFSKKIYVKDAKIVVPAPVLVSVDGVCGDFSSTSQFVPPATLGNKCSVGLNSSLLFNLSNQRWEWSCFGENGGINASCFTNKINESNSNMLTLLSGTNETNLMVSQSLNPGDILITDVGEVTVGSISEIIGPEIDFIPNMTSDTTDGVTILASDLSGNLEHGWGIGSNNSGDSYVVLINANLPAEIYINLSQDRNITKYTVANSHYPDANIAASACITDWTLEGRLDGGSWNLIDTQIGFNPWVAYEAKKLEIDVPDGVYDELKFRITGGNTYSGYVYPGPIDIIGNSLNYNASISSAGLSQIPTKAIKKSEI